MKRKIILLSVLLTVICTSCNSTRPAPDPLPETTAPTEISETERQETEPASRLTAKYVDSNIINPAGGELDGYTEFIILDNNILFVPLFSHFDVNLGTYYNIAENTVIQQFDPHDYWGEPQAAPDEGREILYKARLPRLDDNGEQYFVVCAVYTDRSFDILEDTIENNSIQHYGKEVSRWNSECSLLDAETGEILIDGYDPGGADEYTEEYGWDTSTPRYQFPLDENRFVYQTSGVQALACIGVYDLEAKEAREFPNSADYVPLGVRGGKIYLADGLYNFETDKIQILSADPDTLETEIYMEWSKNGDIQTAMSADGKYIALLYSGTQRLYVVETDTKETFGTDIDEEFTNPCPICFADNDTVIVANWSDKILLIDIE